MYPNPNVPPYAQPYTSHQPPARAQPPQQPAYDPQQVRAALQADPAFAAAVAAAMGIQQPSPQQPQQSQPQVQTTGHQPQGQPAAQPALQQQAQQPTGQPSGPLTMDQVRQVLDERFSREQATAARRQYADQQLSDLPPEYREHFLRTLPDQADANQMAQAAAATRQSFRGFVQQLGVTPPNLGGDASGAGAAAMAPAGNPPSRLPQDLSKVDGTTLLQMARARGQQQSPAGFAYPQGGGQPQPYAQQPYGQPAQPLPGQVPTPVAAYPQPTSQAPVQAPVQSAYLPQQPAGPQPTTAPTAPAPSSGGAA